MFVVELVIIVLVVIAIPSFWRPMDVLYGSDPMLDRYQVIIDSCYDVSNMKV
jgi:hypothetical protein